MSSSVANKTDEYALKSQRGIPVILEPHELCAQSPEEFLNVARQLRDDGKKLAADLFCGAGGLSLGLDRAGFTCVMGIDHDKHAVETHAHHFPGLTADWDLQDPDVVAEIGRLLQEAEIDLIAGGPPCQPFSKAGHAMLRDLVRTGRRPAHDKRVDLWQSFLEIVRIARPRAVLMENVPGMVLDQDMLVLRTLVDELESLGYGVEAQIIDAWRYEVPQPRQRLILIAIENGVRFQWPAASPRSITVRQAISDLPAVEGGWHTHDAKKGWAEYDGPSSTFQKAAREGLKPSDRHKVFDHITRPVREDDAQAFALMDSDTKYTDLPEELKRYRDDIFDDKYKRLDFDDLSRTITAHLAKDGYGFIHPEQDRTLTIREAARIQTFPDSFRFAGSPTNAFRQIGNAVPPNLGFQLGQAILEQLETNHTPINTREVSAVLAKWICQRASKELSMPPWFIDPVTALSNGESITVEMRWLALIGEVLFERMRIDRVISASIWPRLKVAANSPQKTVENQKLIEQIAFSLSREDKAKAILSHARFAGENTQCLETFEGLMSIPGISQSAAHFAARIAPDSSADPVRTSSQLVRTAFRYDGRSEKRTNIRTDGRMAIARLVGIDDEGAEDPVIANRSALAHLGLVEISRTICLPDRPSCVSCPLESSCQSSQAFKDSQPAIPFED